jgi:hypothetical protein
MQLRVEGDMARTITIVCGLLVLPLCAFAGDKPEAIDVDAVDALLRENKAKGVRALGDKAIPALAELFKARKHLRQILPILANSHSRVARTTLEQAVRAKDDNDWLFWQARAIGLLKNAESKSALLATLPRLKKRLAELDRKTIDEPDGLGVLLGGSCDCAFFSVIWALGRIEGKEFGTSWLEKDGTGDYKLSDPLDARDVAACIEWWREYKKTLGRSRN